MKIVLIRHYKVDFAWKFWYNSEEYNHALEGYNTAAVVKTAGSRETKDRLICSTLSRAGSTAKMLFGREPDWCTDVLREVPIRAFVKTRIRLPKIVWDIAGRLFWRFDGHSQPESYTQSAARVNGFISSIIEEGQDAVVVCHGWVMKLMVPRLKALGFRGPSPLFIRNGVPYEYSKR
jgi:broad specificity phosphatase PhoE